MEKDYEDLIFEGYRFCIMKMERYGEAGWGIGMMPGLKSLTVDGLRVYMNALEQLSAELNKRNKALIGKEKLCTKP